MKTLTEAQERAVKVCINSIAEYGGALNSSKTGTGKTVMATYVALRMRCPVIVVCPKAVRPHWEREFAEHGIKPLAVLNYEKIRNGSTPFLIKQGKRAMKWNLPEDTLIIFDECQRCIRKGSLVTLADGSCMPIEDIGVGTQVWTPLGPKRATNKVCTGFSNVVLVTHTEGRLYCTHDHEIYTTNKGWIEAGKTTDKETLLLPRLREGNPRPQEQKVPGLLSGSQDSESPHALRNLWERISNFVVPKKRSELLLAQLRESGESGQPDYGTEREAEGEYEASRVGAPGFSLQTGKNDGQYQPDETGGRSSEGVGRLNRGPAPALVRRKWDRSYSSADALMGRIGGGLAAGILCVGEGLRSLVAPDAGRSRPPGEKVCGRGRWVIPQLFTRAGEGLAEGCVTFAEWLESFTYHKFRDPLRRTRGGFASSRVLRVDPAGQDECYDLSVEDADCFFADGVLVHNCKSPYTLNALLLISAKMQKINTLLLSATAAEDCTEMRALGYALNLHNLNRDTHLLRSWERWMREHGCYRDEWNGWRSGPRKHLQAVHDVMYRDRAIRLTEEDMPEAFRENRIIVEPIEFANLASIRRAYKDGGITPAIVDAMIERTALPPEEQAKLEEENVLTRLLRARQLAEACKVPEFVEMTQDLVEEGFSVAVFLNFRETVLAFQQLMEAMQIPTAMIIGGQHADVREANRLAFSRDEKRVLVCTAASGGVGVDGLQDLNGVFPRTSLISPSFSVQEFKQTLGRLHRAYAKSDVMQKILVASGTVEEDVIAAIQRKLANMETLHGK